MYSLPGRVRLKDKVKTIKELTCLLSNGKYRFHILFELCAKKAAE